MIDGAFNDVLPWNYGKLVELFGDGRAFPVHTEGELDHALIDAAASGELCIMEVRLEKMDASDAKAWRGCGERSTGELIPSVED